MPNFSALKSTFPVSAPTFSDVGVFIRSTDELPVSTVSVVSDAPRIKAEAEIRVVDIDESDDEIFVANTSGQDELAEPSTEEDSELHRAFVKAREEGMQRASCAMQSFRSGQVGSRPTMNFLSLYQDTLPNISADSRGKRHSASVMQWTPPVGTPVATASPLQNRDKHPTQGLRDEDLEKYDFDEVGREEIDRAFIQDVVLDCSADFKKLVAPLQHFPIVETLLREVVQSAQEEETDFRQAMENEKTQRVLRLIKTRTLLLGEQAGFDISANYQKYLNENESHAKSGRKNDPPLSAHDWFEKQRAQEEVQQDGAALVLQMCQKWKKAGSEAWEAENLASAVSNWKNADEALTKFKKQHMFASENSQIQEVHASVLKNCAQACIKLQRWSQALSCASRALEIDDKDHKAWFRKACALEGLHELDEAEECLQKVESLAETRSDKNKLLKETRAKKESIKSIRKQEETVTGKRSPWHGILSGKQDGSDACDRRDTQPQNSTTAQLPQREQHVFEDGRKRLTKQDAKRLLRDLREAYADPFLQRQVSKLAHDVQYDKLQFLRCLKTVALPAQKPILERWGFPGTERGVTEMTLAIADHTRGRNGDNELKEESAITASALRGCMDQILNAPTGAQIDPAACMSFQPNVADVSDDEQKD